MFGDVEKALELQGSEEFVWQRKSLGLTPVKLFC